MAVGIIDLFLEVLLECTDFLQLLIKSLEFLLNVDMNSQLKEYFSCLEVRNSTTFRKLILIFNYIDV